MGGARGCPDVVRTSGIPKGRNGADPSSGDRGRDRLLRPRSRANGREERATQSVGAIPIPAGADPPPTPSPNPDDTLTGRDFREVWDERKNERRVERTRNGWKAPRSLPANPARGPSSVWRRSAPRRRTRRHAASTERGGSPSAVQRPHAARTRSRASGERGISNHRGTRSRTPSSARDGPIGWPDAAPWREAPSRSTNATDLGASATNGQIGRGPEPRPRNGGCGPIARPRGAREAGGDRCGAAHPSTARRFAERIEKSRRPDGADGLFRYRRRRQPRRGLGALRPSSSNSVGGFVAGLLGDSEIPPREMPCAASRGPGPGPADELVVGTPRPAFPTGRWQALPRCLPGLPRGRAPISAWT